MLFDSLRSASKDYADFVERQVEMGLDAVVELPPRPPVVVNDHYNLHGLPVRYDPRVTISEWIESRGDEAVPILIKEYRTPAGTLRTEVRQTKDWRWGSHVPFLDDYIVPRARRFPVAEEGDIEALRYLLVSPTTEEIEGFRRDCAPALGLARKRGLLVTGGWGVGADLVGWICGLQNMIYLVYDQPRLVREVLGLIATWNRGRMEVVLGAGIDLFVKRAWYENLDFWTPATWRQYLLPILKSEVDLVHERGAKFGYIITSSCMGLLDMIAEAKVDVVIGVDPHAWDLPKTKDRLGGRVCLWGGVNGHLTVEEGRPEEVRAEVRRAIEVLAPGGGFILSPVDNLREDTASSRENVKALLAEWRSLAGIDKPS
jgi:hypothetical protein